MIYLKQYDLKDYDQAHFDFKQLPLFYRPKFLDYHRHINLVKKFNSFQWHNLLIYKNDKIISNLTGHTYIENNTNIYCSSYVGSFGGHWFKDHTYSRIKEVVSETIIYLRKIGVHEIKIVVPSSIYSSNTLNVIYEQVLLEKNFTLQKSYLNHHIEVQNDKEFKDVLPSKTKYELTKAKKYSNRVKEYSKWEDYKIFYEMLLENRKRFNKPITHSLEDIKYLYSNYSECMVLAMSTNNKELRSGILCFKTSPKSLYLFYPCDKLNFRNENSIYLIYEWLYNYANAIDFKYLDLGPSSFSFTAHDSLIKFKESLGAKSTLKKEYSLNIRG